jgi:hypothetical protein
MPLIVYSQEMRGEAGTAIFLGKIDQVLDFETNTFTRCLTGYGAGYGLVDVKTQHFYGSNHEVLDL